MTDLVTLPAVPTSRDDLLIAALRHANEVGSTLNDISAEVFRLLGDQVDDPKYEPLHALLRRRFAEVSAVYLFIAADNLRIDLPGDLKGDAEEDEGE
jgi:ABC-type transporter Mla subunit MlaD